MTETSNIAETAAVKKSGNKLAFLAFILALAAIGSSGYLYYMGIQYTRAAQMQLGVIAIQNSTQTQLNQDQIVKLQDSVEKIFTKLNEVSGNKTGIIAFQVNELISMANQDIIVYSDIPGSIRLLSRARDILETSNNAVFTGLKLALGTDLSKLNSLPLIDKVILSGELDSLSSEIAGLHLDAINTAAANTANATGSAWSRFIDNIKNNLLGLVNVTQSEQSQNNILLPKEEIILKDSIRVNLLSAKMALLEHDQLNWESSLNNAKTTIATGFANYAKMSNLTNQLSSLSAMKINNPDANIDATLRQLVKLNNLQ